jgi:hypothetical protein
MMEDDKNEFNAQIMNVRNQSCHSRRPKVEI